MSMKAVSVVHQRLRGGTPEVAQSVLRRRHIHWTQVLKELCELAVHEPQVGARALRDIRGHLAQKKLRPSRTLRSAYA